MAIPVRHPLLALTASALYSLQAKQPTKNIVLPPFVDCVLHFLNPNFGTPIKGCYVLEHHAMEYVGDDDWSRLSISHPSLMFSSDPLQLLAKWGNINSIDSTHIDPEIFVGTDNEMRIAIPLPPPPSSTSATDDVSRWCFTSISGEMSVWLINLSDKAKKEGNSGAFLQWTSKRNDGGESSSSRRRTFYDVAVLPDQQRLVATVVEEVKPAQPLDEDRVRPCLSSALDEGLMILSINDGTILNWIPFRTVFALAEVTLNHLAPVANPWTGWVAVAQNSTEHGNGIWLWNSSPSSSACRRDDTPTESSSSSSPEAPSLTSLSAWLEDMAWVGRERLCVSSSNGVREYVLTFETSGSGPQSGAPKLTAVRQLMISFYKMVPLRCSPGGGGGYSLVFLYVHPLDRDLVKVCSAQVPPPHPDREPRNPRDSEEAVEQIKLRNLVKFDHITLEKCGGLRTMFGWME